MLVACLAAVVLLGACSLLESVPRPGNAPVATTATPRPGDNSLPGGAATPVDDRPVVGSVEVWLGDYGLMAWQRRLPTPGRYLLDLHNHGYQPHDVTIARAPRGIEGLPSRQGRVLLQDVDIVARSEVLPPRDNVGPSEATVSADLEPGRYVLFSSEGVDFGRGMATEIVVGEGSGGPEPDATPGGAGEVAAVYLVDYAVFLSRPTVEHGEVRLLVQNLGPSTHDVVVVRWRGDPTALPVLDDRLLMDALIEIGRTGPIAPGERATLDVELDGQYAYVVLSSLGTDYADGMQVQLFVR